MLVLETSRERKRRVAIRFSYKAENNNNNNNNNNNTIKKKGTYRRRDRGCFQ
jgi:hypothetical protein